MDEASREPLEAIKEEARKLETMVRAVAEYSSIEMGPEASVNLWVIIEEAKKKIEDHPAVAGQPLEWKTECPDMNVKVDRPLMVQALAEVLLNAAEFGGPTTVVEICAREKESTIRIGVVDNGPRLHRRGAGNGLRPLLYHQGRGRGHGADQGQAHRQRAPGDHGHREPGRGRGQGGPDPTGEAVRDHALAIFALTRRPRRGYRSANRKGGAMDCQDVKQYINEKNALARLLGIEVTEIGEGAATCVMKVRDDHMNPFGTVNAGATYALAEARVRRGGQRARPDHRGPA